MLLVEAISLCETIQTLISLYLENYEEYLQRVNFLKAHNLIDKEIFFMLGSFTLHKTA